MSNKKNNNGANLGFESKLWAAADKLRGHMDASEYDRVHRDLSDEEIDQIAATYHAWRGEKETDEYKDVPGFCKSAATDEVRQHGFVLTPGRYVGAAEVEDDGIPFDEKMAELSARLYEQFKEADRLEATIKKNLALLGFGAKE